MSKEDQQEEQEVNIEGLAIRYAIDDDIVALPISQVVRTMQSKFPREFDNVCLTVAFGVVRGEHKQMQTVVDAAAQKGAKSSGQAKQQEGNRQARRAAAKPKGRSKR